MTDPQLDDLASAYLDGVATPAEVARVDGDPALRARVQELADVRAALRVEPAVDPRARDRAVAAAVQAFRDDRRPGGAATVRTLTASRWSAPRGRAVLGAVAVLVLLALLVPLLGHRDSDDQTATATFQETGSSIDDRGAAASGGATAEDAAAPTDLGDFPTVEDLLAALPAAELTLPQASSSTAASTPPAGTVSCPSTYERTGTVAQRTTATVAGDAVLVVVRTSDDGTTTATVYRLTGCSPIGSRRLP